MEPIIDKDKIRIEELYRLEIRKDLEEEQKKKTSLPKSFWSFLNSSFGVWLLSAIFVTGLGAAYTSLQNSRTEFKQNQEAIQKLELEVEYRISKAIYSLESIHQRKKTEPTADILTDVKKVLEEFSKPPTREFSSLYSDYLNFSTVATVAEIRRRLPEKDRSPIDVVLAHLTGIYVLMDVKKAPLDDAEKVAGVLLENIRLPRWSNRFYFMDCPPKIPFC